MRTSKRVLRAFVVNRVLDAMVFRSQAGVAARLIPLLKGQKIAGYAVSALAEMGGKDSLTLMMAELESGNDVFGMIYQHLKRLTNQNFENKPEPWLEWWKKSRGS